MWNFNNQNRWRHEADPSRLIGGRFNKQENLYMRLVLGGHKTSRSLHLPARILKVYTEALTGFSHIYHPDDLNSTVLSQGCILETAPTMGRTYTPRRGEGVRRLWLPRSSSWDNWWSHPFNDLFQHHILEENKYNETHWAKWQNWNMNGILDKNLWRHMHPNIHCSTIYNSQDIDTS